MKKTGFLIIALMLMLSTPAWALCGSIGDWIDGKANSDAYLVKMGGMMLQGVHQVVESPVVLLKGSYEGISNPDPSLLAPNGEVPGYLNGLVKGTFKGSGNALDKLIAAVGNVVYSLVPGQGPIYVGGEEEVGME